LKYLATITINSSKSTTSKAQATCDILLLCFSIRLIIRISPHPSSHQSIFCNLLVLLCPKERVGGYTRSTKAEGLQREVDIRYEEEVDIKCPSQVKVMADSP
jgi:hypothetical protein